MSERERNEERCRIMNKISLLRQVEEELYSEMSRIDPNENRQSQQTVDKHTRAIEEVVKEIKYLRSRLFAIIIV